MMKFFRLFAALIVASVVCGPAFAQTPSAASIEKRALAERLVVALDMGNNFKNVMAQTAGRLQLDGFKDAQAQQAVAESFGEAMPEAFAASKADFIAAVDSAYSLEELRAGVAFFESPAGRSFNAKGAPFAAALAPYMPNWFLRAIGPWEKSYCRKVSCTPDDHAQFAAMRQQIQAAR
ncbi:hypothetical protein BH10PSE5_BH10PSE5_13500 [soil metagenome]